MKEVQEEEEKEEEERKPTTSEAARRSPTRRPVVLRSPASNDPCGALQSTYGELMCTFAAILSVQVGRRMTSTTDSARAGPLRK